MADLESVKITGSYRLKYTIKDWGDNQKERGGNFRFNQLNLGAEAEKNGVRLSSQCRMYDNSNSSMIHHLYLATAINGNIELQQALPRCRLVFNLMKATTTGMIMRCSWA